MTHLAVTDSPLDTLDADAIVIGLTTGDDLVPHGHNIVLDRAFDGRLIDAFSHLGATGKAGQITTIATLGAIKSPILTAMGLGDAAKVQCANTRYDAAETVRRAAGNAVRALAGKERIAFAVEDPALLPAIAEGALLGAYDFIQFKSSLADDYKTPVSQITIALPTIPEDAHEIVRKIEITIAAVMRARHWVNTPANALRPPSFADAAATMAQECGLEVEILDENALREGGYGGILAVGGASEAAPRLVRLRYNGRQSARHLALVGKGITFDSGGLSLKTPTHMANMHGDMAGAAAVIATMGAISQLQPDINVTAYVPMAENMVAGSSYRPGDVITMRDGKKVEIFNTDAEGRIILADAISRACDDSPDYLVEVSTLTGAQTVALGSRIAGIMGTESFVHQVSETGETCGEKMWHMPFAEDVSALLESSVADIAQVDKAHSRVGAMLQGGTFLKAFVRGNVSWAHIDIAGPAFNKGNPYGYVPSGATGFPVRTLVRLAQELGEHP